MACPPEGQISFCVTLLDINMGHYMTLVCSCLLPGTCQLPLSAEDTSLKTHLSHAGWPHSALPLVFHSYRGQPLQWLRHGFILPLHTWEAADTCHLGTSLSSVTLPAKTTVGGHGDLTQADFISGQWQPPSLMPILPHSLPMPSVFSLLSPVPTLPPPPATTYLCDPFPLTTPFGHLSPSSMSLVPGLGQNTLHTYTPSA